MILLKYEDMVGNFDSWLASILAFLEFSPGQETLSRIKNDADFSVQEDISQHKRQVTPGDHKRKLKPETIESLNAILEPVLAPLGYT